MQCLWCKRATMPPIPEEHIIPDSLGCPADFVFRNGEVCGRCNNRNARLDQALVSDFEIHRFITGVPNKKGRAPTISTRANARGASKGGESYIFVNEGRQVEHTPFGNLAPLKHRESDLRLSIHPTGMAECEITLTQKGVCNSKASVRALHKIALSLLARHAGVAHAMSNRYDAIRQFVLTGSGERTAILVSAGEGMEYRNEIYASTGAVFPAEVVAFRLVAICFLIDLSPSQEHLPAIKGFCSQLLGMRNWTWAPIEH